MIIAYQIKQGAKFRLIAVGTQESEKIHLPFLDFQEEATSREPHEWPKLVRIMDYTADAGPRRMKRNRSHYAKEFLNSGRKED